MLGGGGVAYGLPNMAIQLAAIVCLAYQGPELLKLYARGNRTVVALVGITIALPIVQMIPIPKSLWATLPSRELLQVSLNAVDASQWHPVTVNTSRTLVSFLGLLMPLTVFALGLKSNEFAKQTAKIAFIAMGVCGALLGSFQLLSLQNHSLLYPEATNIGMLTGFFANRNSAAVFFVCCLLLLVSFDFQRISVFKLMGGLSAGAVLVVGVILTQSRTGLILLGPPVILLGLRFIALRSAERDTLSIGNRSGRMVAAGFLGCAALIVAISGLSDNLFESRLGTVLARFDTTTDERSAIWEDALVSAQRYWPVGSGMGTFDEVFQIDESLENVSTRRAGRAHNDYLEIAIEAGFVGLAIIGLWIGWTLWATWSALARIARWEALSASNILLVIGLQSVFDYPLRNQTMLCLAAFTVGLLACSMKAEPLANAVDRRSS